MHTKGGKRGQWKTEFADLTRIETLGTREKGGARKKRTLNRKDAGRPISHKLREKCDRGLSMDQSGHALRKEKRKLNNEGTSKIALLKTWGGEGKEPQRQGHWGEVPRSKGVGFIDVKVG